MRVDGGRVFPQGGSQASFIVQNVPAMLIGGQPYTTRVTMQNTGGDKRRKQEALDKRNGVLK